MEKIHKRLLFFGKDGDAMSEQALGYLQQHFADIEVYRYKRGERFPQEALQWQGEYVISYLCGWLIPAPVLQAATVAAINFHPGPPEYPGIGCTNFAVYDEVNVFGATCHHMAEKVDSGSIIAVRRFPITPNDSVYSITKQNYVHMAAMFYEVIGYILRGEELPISDEKWQRKPYTRRELNALCKIELDMPLEEIRRRVKATTFPGAPGAFLEIDGMRFEYVHTT